ncbi:MAG: hypothetical protein ACYDHW_03765 [Syntrophorhabdaceae bacterium]
MNFSGVRSNKARRMLCVCAWCRKIRTDKGIWIVPEIPVRDNPRTMLTHGICPLCAQKLLSAEKIESPHGSV